MAEFLRDAVQNNLENIDLFSDEIFNLLSTNIWQSGNGYYDTAMQVSAIVKPIALTIVGICFLIEFLKITINMDVLKWEYALKCFFKLVFSRVCIDLSFDLMAAIYATGASWINSIGDPSNLALGVKMWDALKDEIKNYNLLSLVGMFITSGIMLMAAEICCIIVLVTVYATLFELTVYMTIAPLPCAFLPLEDGGASRIPKKFILNYAGICLHLVFIAICFNLYSNLCSTVILPEITNYSAIIGFGKLLLVTLVFVMAVTKSGSWAQRIFDGA